MRGFALLLFLTPGITVYSQKTEYFVAGTYTGGKSTGIYLYAFNKKKGAATLIDSIRTSNPSYLAVSEDSRFVYAVNEDNAESGGGKVSAFAINLKRGKLRLLNQQSSMGDHPCYVSIDHTGKWLAAGNYSSGSVALFPINTDGSLGKAVAVSTHSGHGANPARQASAHVHAAVFSPDNQYLFVPDLGMDQVVVYQFDEAHGSIRKDAGIKMPAGTGPRHLDFHPNGKWAYLVQELSGNITAFNYQKGRMDPIQTVSTLPIGFKGSFTAADIHVAPDGKFLYASVRDSANILSIFSIDQQSGKLSVVGFQPVLGKTPRNFSIDPSGDYLLVANQNSNDIVTFRINHKTGLLQGTGERIYIPLPVCIKWIRDE
jgi:6-phosphogluconolactonase